MDYSTGSNRWLKSKTKDSELEVFEIASVSLVAFLDVKVHHR